MVKLSFVAGCDVAYDEQYAYAVWAVLSFSELEVVGVTGIREVITVEYQSGYFAERELPPLLRAFRRVKVKPDVIICDGAGVAHPRKFGLACALGQAVNIPTIGCAKSWLVGEVGVLGREKGAYAPIRIGKEVVGVALRTKSNVKPVYVSPGYLITVSESWQVVLHCCRGVRLPEPIRVAHHYALKLRSGQGIGRKDVIVNQLGLGEIV